MDMYSTSGFISTLTLPMEISMLNFKSYDVPYFQREASKSLNISHESYFSIAFWCLGHENKIS